jgi:hypothetical protein
MNKEQIMIIKIEVSAEILKLFLDGNGRTYGLHRFIDYMGMSDKTTAEITKQLGLAAQLQDEQWMEDLWVSGNEVKRLAWMDSQVNECDFSEV